MILVYLVDLYASVLLAIMETYVKIKLVSLHLMKHSEFQQFHWPISRDASILRMC